MKFGVTTFFAFLFFIAAGGNPVGAKIDVPAACYSDDLPRDGAAFANDEWNKFFIPGKAHADTLLRAINGAHKFQLDDQNVWSRHILPFEYHPRGPQFCDAMYNGNHEKHLTTCPFTTEGSDCWLGDLDPESKNNSGQKIDQWCYAQIFIALYQIDNWGMFCDEYWEEIKNDVNSPDRLREFNERKTRDEINAKVIFDGIAKENVRLGELALKLSDEGLLAKALDRTLWVYSWGNQNKLYKKLLGYKKKIAEQRIQAQLEEAKREEVRQREKEEEARATAQREQEAEAKLKEVREKAEIESQQAQLKLSETSMAAAKQAIAQKNWQAAAQHLKTVEVFSAPDMEKEWIRLKRAIAPKINPPSCASAAYWWHIDGEKSNLLYMQPPLNATGELVGWTGVLSNKIGTDYLADAGKSFFVFSKSLGAPLRMNGFVCVIGYYAGLKTFKNNFGNSLPSPILNPIYVTTVK